MNINFDDYLIITITYYFSDIRLENIYHPYADSEVVTHTHMKLMLWLYYMHACKIL